MNLTVQDAGWIVLGIMLNVVAFIVAQCAAVRFAHPRRLLVFSSEVFILSSLGVLALAYILAGRAFSSFSNFVAFAIVEMVGSGGVCALYTFLGPATADRSATAHMLGFLKLHNPSIVLAALREAFESDAFIQKRLDECAQARLIEIDGDAIRLTPRGRCLAQSFALINQLCGMDHQPGYRCSFQRPQQQNVAK